MTTRKCRLCGKVVRNIKPNDSRLYETTFHTDGTRTIGSIDKGWFTCSPACHDLVRTTHMR